MMYSQQFWPCMVANGKEQKKSLPRSDKSTDLPTPYYAAPESDWMVISFDSVWLFANGKK